MVALLAHTPCSLCGYRIETLMTGTARINKRSIRISGPLLGAFRYTRCPECRSDVCADEMRPRSAYRLVPEDAVKVAAYRLRKWGAESADGPLGGICESHQPAGMRVR